MPRANIDWEKARKDYIENDFSYRYIAEKYGITKTGVASHAQKEKWIDQKKAFLDKKRTVIEQRSVNVRADANYKLFQLAMSTLDKMGELDVTASTVKNITGAIKDLKEVLNCRSDLDIEEQRLRLKKMQKELEADEQQNKAIDVTFTECEEYAK